MNLDIQEDTAPSELTNKSPLAIIHQYIAHIIKLNNRELKSYTPTELYESLIGCCDSSSSDCRFNINLGVYETTKMETKKIFLQDQDYQNSLERHKSNGNKLMLGTIFVVFFGLYCRNYSSNIR